MCARVLVAAAALLPSRFSYIQSAAAADGQVQTVVATRDPPLLLLRDSEVVKFLIEFLRLR